MRCRTGFNREGLIMASQTKMQANSGFNRRLFLAGAAGGAMLPIAARAEPKKKRGIYADPAGTPKETLEDKVADFSYQNDVLAQLIVDIWAGPHANLITPATTKPQYQARSAAAKAVLEDSEHLFGGTNRDHGRRVRRRFQFGRRRPNAKIGVVFVLPRTTRRELLVDRLCLRRPRC